MSNNTPVKPEVKPDAKPEVKAEEAVKEAGPLLETIHVNLAPSAVHLNYAGRQYVHGQTYTVDRDTAWALKEMMNRGWSHEASLTDKTDYTKRGRQTGRSFA